MPNQVIIYNQPNGVAAVVVPSGEISIEDVAAKDIPAGVDHHIIDRSSIPDDRLFRNAWTVSGKQITHDIAKVKEIAHSIRRTKRAEEFQPLDEQIMKRIPGINVDEVEAKRQTIRTRYAEMQKHIDAATTTDELKAALEGGPTKLADTGSKER